MSGALPPARPRRVACDANAAVPLLPEVAEAVARTALEAWGNASSTHEEGRKARAALDVARERVATALGARPREIVFTSGATEALHLAVLGAARARAAASRRVIVSAVEHPAALDPAHALGAEGFDVVRVPPRPDGGVEGEAFLAACSAGAAVAVLMAANHETGAVMPVASVAAGLAAQGIPLVVDAALAPGLLDVSVGALGAPLVAFSGAKIGGPRGSGVLYVRRRTRLVPVQRGGVQEDRLRGGSENVPGAVGFSLALAHAVRTREARVRRVTNLLRRLVAGLLELPGTSLLGPDRDDPQRVLPSTATVAFDGCEGEALLVHLDLAGISVSTGSACAVGGTEASPVLLAMGVSGRRAASTLRFSLRDDVDEADVDRVRTTVGAAVGRLRSMTR